MDRWNGKVALVTGASAGIGAAVASKLVKCGMKVVGCARNLERLESLSNELNKEGPGEMFAVRCDLKIEKEILSAFQQIREKYGTMHVLINNAGHAHAAPLLTGSTDDWNSMMLLNVMSPCICSREAVKLMDESGVDDGHIVNMNSVSGYVVDARAESHFYQVTKFGLTAMTEGLRRELVSRKSHIRVTSISPGFVKTEFQYRMFPEDPGKAKMLQNQYVIMKAEDIAEEVAFVLASPPRVNICEMIVRPTEQA